MQITRCFRSISSIVGHAVSKDKHETALVHARRSKIASTDNNVIGLFERLVRKRCPWSKWYVLQLFLEYLYVEVYKKCNY